MTRNKRKRSHQAKKPVNMLPPLSAQAEAAFYLQRLGELEHDDAALIDFPPSFSFEKQRRVNNRAPGWNGVFSFTFAWTTEATAQVRQDIEQSLTRDYGCQMTDGEDGLGCWDVQVKMTGKRVKRLTAMLNRQHSRGYLVWHEW